MRNPSISLILFSMLGSFNTANAASGGLQVPTHHSLQTNSTKNAPDHSTVTLSKGNNSISTTAAPIPEPDSFEQRLQQEKGKVVSEHTEAEFLNGQVWLSQQQKQVEISQTAKSVANTQKVPRKPSERWRRNRRPESELSQ